MIEIRKVIHAQLKTIHPRVYFLKAPETAVFPYLVYEIELTDLGDNLQMVTLDVDGWDDKADTTNLETIMANVKNSINKNMTITENLIMVTYLDRILPLTDPDPKINRRKYIYQGRLYERS